MKPSRISFLIIALAIGLAPLSSGAGKAACPVTKPPGRPFVPPAPYDSTIGGGEFLYGTPALWTLIHTDWNIHSGGKLPFFRQGYDWMNEKDPRLTVVARQLDGNAPLVWNGWANSASVPGRGIAGMFMVTGIDIPSAACWEITAHYAASRDNIHTLSYIVWVEPWQDAENYGAAYFQ